MTRMDKESKQGCAYHMLILLGVILLLAFIKKLWPIILIALAGLVIVGLKLAFSKAQPAEDDIPAEQPATPPPETEFSIIQKSFGLLQRRISEQVALQFPGAKWVWGVTNAVNSFRNNEPLFILLNGAGGYKKVHIVIYNLMFNGLRYITAEHANPQPEIRESPRDDVVVHLEEEPLPEDAPINYGRLAFEWVDSNMSDINEKYNEAIAQHKACLLIPAEDLPHPDSWPDVCEELKRIGFAVAEICEYGITINIAQ